jgi:hypothetical protein
MSNPDYLRRKKLVEKLSELLECLESDQDRNEAKRTFFELTSLDALYPDTNTDWRIQRGGDIQRLLNKPNKRPAADEITECKGHLSRWLNDAEATQRQDT